MSLDPLLQASPIIQLHAFAAMAAFVVGLLQFAGSKGTTPHRARGWIFVLLMVIVSGTAFFIHELRLWGPWSPIHLLAIFTVVMLPIGVRHARRRAIRAHAGTMIGIFFGGLVVAGAFTLLPGRIMHAVVFGP